MKKYQTILNLMKRISAKYYDNNIFLDKLWNYFSKKLNEKYRKSLRTNHNEDY